MNMPLYTGFVQLGAGLAVGLAGLAAGFAIGIVGDAGARGVAQQPRMFIGMVLILIFAEVSLILSRIAARARDALPRDEGAGNLRTNCGVDYEFVRYEGDGRGSESAQSSLGPLTQVNSVLYTNGSNESTLFLFTLCAEASTLR